MEMTLTRRPAPHMRHSDSITVSMADVILSLIPCVAMGWYYYGFRLLINVAASVLACMAAELIISFIIRRRHTLGDLTAVVTGIIIGMLLPVGISYTYLLMAATVATVVGKAMFGGVGKNIFNPALCGIAFVTLANTTAMTQFYSQKADLPLFSAVSAEEFAPVTSVLFEMRAGNELDVSLFDMFVGRQNGMPASVCLPLLIVAAAYLIHRRIVSPQITLSMLVTVAVIAVLVPRGDTALSSVGYELMSGSIVFCAVFCANDPATTPNTAAGQLFFGIFAGVITMLIRYYGSFEEGIVFAILIMNSMSFALDKLIHKLRSYRRGGARA